MSNGLHHVAPASFFPTAKELSSGLQWFKDHPILAAAAATAVSVVTYLHTADDSEINDTSVDGDFDKAAVAATTDDVALDGHERSPRAVRRSSAPAVTTSPSSTTILAATTTTTTATPTPSHHPPTRRASAPLGRVTPPALRKPGSEGKLSSPAAVSWVDEHGGSLTQVFEHLTTVDDPHDRHELRSGTHSDLHGTTPEDDDAEDDEDDGYPDLDRPLRQGGSSPRLYGRPPTPRRNAHTRPGEDDMPESSSSPASSAHWMGKLAHGAMQSPQLVGAAHDRQTPSPQWGWYVPITPPQDASAGPPSSSTSSGSLQLHGNSSDRAESSMRRSTSGRIKT